MLEFHVFLHSIEDVRSFVSAATLCPADIDVISGRYTVDAKSIMGLFSLSLDKPVLVRAYGESADAESFKNQVAHLIPQE